MDESETRANQGMVSLDFPCCLNLANFQDSLLPQRE